MVGTLFVDRQRRLRSRQTADEVAATLRSGKLVVLFPESQEHDVLPDGAELEVLDQFNEWLQVRDPQDRLGWLTSHQVARFP
jgi:1-acyl-sn-glycerol-3-phosphate acyltransferase